MTPKAMDAPPAVFRVADAWRGEWMGPSLFRRAGATLHYLGQADAAAHAAEAGAPGTGVVTLPGVLLPGFTDHHVHLQLLSAPGGQAAPAAPSVSGGTGAPGAPVSALESLAEGGFSRVIDLGGSPDALALLAKPDPFSPAVEFAGAFLTAPGGYPSDRAWALAGSWREVASADDAELAVAEQLSAGASRIKIVLHADAGPVWGDALLAEVVGVVRAAGIPVVAHVEGARQAARAIAAGVDILAHAPFSEPLAEALIAQAVAQGQRWVSTLAIHDEPERAIAIENVRAFRAAGGQVLYGSDMGNGDQPLGVNPAELTALEQAGLDETAVLRALVGGFGRGRWKKRVTWLHRRPSTTERPDELFVELPGQFLAGAQSIAVGDLESVGA